MLANILADGSVGEGQRMIIKAEWRQYSQLGTSLILLEEYRCCWVPWVLLTSGRSFSVFISFINICWNPTVCEILFFTA